MRETHTADPAEQTSEMLPTFTCGALLLTNIATNSKCRESDATKQQHLYNNNARNARRGEQKVMEITRKHKTHTNILVWRAVLAASIIPHFDHSLCSYIHFDSCVSNAY